MKRIFKRTLENKKQNDVFFFSAGDCGATLEVEYKEKKYEILAIANGEKELYDKDGEIFYDDLKYIYNSDKELNKIFEKEILKIGKSNWFYILIICDGKEYKSEDYIYSLNELEELNDEEIIELIEETIK